MASTMNYMVNNENWHLQWGTGVPKLLRTRKMGGRNLPRHKVHQIQACMPNVVQSIPIWYGRTCFDVPKQNQMHNMHLTTMSIQNSKNCQNME